MQDPRLRLLLPQSRSPPLQAPCSRRPDLVARLHAAHTGPRDPASFQPAAMITSQRLSLNGRWSGVST